METENWLRLSRPKKKKFRIYAVVLKKEFPMPHHKVCIVITIQEWRAITHVLRCVSKCYSSRSLGKKLLGLGVGAPFSKCAKLHHLKKTPKKCRAASDIDSSIDRKGLCLA